MPNKYNLEINKLDPSLGLEEGMSAVENSLVRTEKIIDDIDKRVGNIAVPSNEILWDKKTLDGSDITSFASDTVALQFNNILPGTYRWTIVCNFEIDGLSGSTWSTNLDVDFYVKLYNSSDVAQTTEWFNTWEFDTNNGLIDITNDSSPVTDGNFEYNNEGPLSYLKGAVSGTGIFKTTRTNDKLKFIVDEDTSLDHIIKGNTGSTYFMLEKLPNHKKTTRWD